MGTAEERLGFEKELASLEAKLAEVDDWQNRLKELDGLLSVQEIEDEM